MKLSVTLSGPQVKNALLYYINDNEKFDIGQFKEQDELILSLDSTDKFDTSGDDTITIEFEKSDDEDVHHLVEDELPGGVDDAGSSLED